MILADRPTAIRRARTVGVLAMLLLAICGAPAAAQRNSMFRGNGRPHTGAVGPQAPPVPTTQPVLPGGGLGVRPPAPPVYTGEPPPNPVLLAASPFAVEMPQPRRIEVNSLVTIIIRESRTTLNDAKMKSKKEWELKSELAEWIRLDLHDRLVPQAFAGGTPKIDFDLENTYKGEGKYDRKDALTTRITARVIDVKPNGNLVLEARKRIKVGDEVLIATLTGECRSDDVTAANTVLSTQIADLEIEMPDRGAVRDATRRGWLMRLFDLLRPF